MTWLGRDEQGILRDFTVDGSTVTNATSGDDEVLSSSGGGGDVTVTEGAITDPNILRASSGLTIGSIQVGATVVQAKLLNGDPSTVRADIEMIATETSIRRRSAADVLKAELEMTEASVTLKHIGTGTAQLVLNGSDSLTLGFAANQLYIDSTTVAFFGGNGAAQSAAITDATDAATTMARLNTLLAYLRSLGLIAT